jgi:hypothetical protein
MAALLCEACGYEIGGLPRHGACPECGGAIAGSLPERRRGSAWQQRRSLWALVRTNVGVLRRPREVFGVARLDVWSGVWLAVINCLLSAMLLVAPWSGVFVGDPLRGSIMRGRGAGAAVWLVPAQVVGVAAVLLGLTLVEWAGIQLVARRRGWRLGRIAAWQVCAHASVGWVVMGMTMWVALIAWLNAIWFVRGLKQAGDLTLAAIPVTGILVGLLVFELLVWIGARRCRFANAAGE